MLARLVPVLVCKFWIIFASLLMYFYMNFHFLYMSRCMLVFSNTFHLFWEIQITASDISCIDTLTKQPQKTLGQHFIHSLTRALPPLQAPRPGGNDAYVKFDVLFKYLIHCSNLMQFLPQTPLSRHIWSPSIRSSHVRFKFQIWCSCDNLSFSKDYVLVT
jgi:hypothetical protein